MIPSPSTKSCLNEGCTVRSRWSIRCVRVALVLLTGALTVASVAAQTLDPASFILVKKKGGVPDQVFTSIGEEKSADLANPGRRYTTGCIRKTGVPNSRMNWAAHDEQGVWLLSISHGGRAHYTVIYKVLLINGSAKAEAFNGHELGANGGLEECIELLNANALERTSVE